MARHPGAEAIYDVVDQFRTRCLIEGRSLLWPDVHCWTNENLDAFKRAFLDEPDYGEGTFEEKWQKQLADEPDDVIRIAADLITIYLLMPAVVAYKPETKHERLNEILAWRPDRLNIAVAQQTMLKNAFSTGIAKTGTNYSAGRFLEIRYLLLFVRALIRERIDPLDLDSCKALARRITAEVNSTTQMSVVILHLLFPDQIEDSASNGHRQDIIKRWNDWVTDLTDPDDQLTEIRRRLSHDGADKSFWFYRPDVQREWDPQYKGALILRIESPGGDRTWQECLRDEVIVVGYDKLGDLKSYVRDDHQLAAFRREYGLDFRGQTTRLNQISQGLRRLLWLRKGDRIVATRGTNQVLATGTVTSGYQWRSDRSEYRHTLGVEWDTSHEQTIADQHDWSASSISELSGELLKSIEEHSVNGKGSTGGGATGGVEIPPSGYIEPPFEEIVAAIVASGLRIDERTLRRYHLSLRTRKFVILSGPSGTGKTWLATAWANAAGAKSLVAPVAPNWTTNEDLLGYLSPLTETYIDTPFSRFLRAAVAEQARADAAGVIATPYHLVLDEMNLARVEYYFARFLSAMEQRARGEPATIELGDDSLPLPDNLVVIGTVNIDETTHGFADKVYDRAQLIELGIDRVELAAYLQGQVFAGSLLEAWNCVEAVKPFAFRVAREFIAYIGDAVEHGVPWEEAFDEQILQKVLPRLTGADLELMPALERLQAWSAGRYPLTNQRVSLMIDRLHRTGVSSYFA